MRLKRSASRRRSPTTRCVYQTIDPRSNAMSAAKISSGLPRRIASADPIGPQIRAQRLRNAHGAVRTLVVLEEAGDGAREREPRTVEGMHETGLLSLRCPKADVGAPGLEVGEVAARRNLEPRADARRPRLEIVRLGGGETGVAGGEQLAAVRHTEQLEHRLRMTREELVLVGGVLGSRVANQLHFVELVRP